ncbi:MAG: methyltransferase [Anaerolineaceae bacterium]|nr:methyltransferase [Anaerolineaceae bacterium]
MLPDFIGHIKSFALARAMMAALELNIFPLLAESPRQRSELIRQAGLADSPITHGFLDILIASELLAEKDGKITLLPLGQSVLPSYESMQSWSREMDLYYRSLDDLPQVLKTGDFTSTSLTQYWAYKGTTNRAAIQSSAVSDYSAVMAGSQNQLSQVILDTYDFSAMKHVIDFGGGYGHLGMALARRHPHLKVTVADLPAVCEGAKARIADAGLAVQVDCLPIDFLKDTLPNGVADAILFSRVLHDWGGDEAAVLLERTRVCLNGSGVALIIEPMPDGGTAPDPSSAITNLMLTLMGGKRRSVQEMMRFLEKAGYRDITWRDCGLSLYKMVVAHV